MLKDIVESNSIQSPVTHEFVFHIIRRLPVFPNVITGVLYMLAPRMSSRVAADFTLEGIDTTRSPRPS
jgi:hypothetical protein